MAFTYTQSQTRVKRFNAEAIAIDVKFEKDASFADVIKNLDTLIERVCAPNEMVGAEIKHPSLDKSLLIPFSTNLSADTIMSLMERVQQSHKEFVYDQAFQLKLVKVYK